MQRPSLLIANESEQLTLVKNGQQLGLNQQPQGLMEIITSLPMLLSMLSASIKYDCVIRFRHWMH